MAAKKSAAFVGRNVYGPQADRMLFCGSMNDTALAAPGHPTNAAPQRINGNMVTLAGSAAWSSDSNGNYFNASANSFVIGVPTSGVDYLLPEWTLQIVFKDVGDNTTVRPLFLSSSGSPVSTTHGVLLVQFVNATDTLRINIRDGNAGVNRIYDFVGVTRTGVLYNLIIRGGGLSGVTASLNGVAQSTTTQDPTAYQGPMRSVDGNTWAVGVGNTGLTGNAKYYAFNVWDVQLTDDEVTKLVEDPFLMSREPPGYTQEIASATSRANSTAYTVGQLRRFSASSSYIYECTTAGTSGGSTPSEATYDTQTVADGSVTWTARVPSYFLGWATAWPGRALTTGMSFQFCSSPWLIGTGSTIKVRVKVATTVAGLDAASPTTSSTISTGGSGTRIDVTGLSAGTSYYWRAEWTPDNGTSWYSFPVGVGTFKTRTTSGSVNWNCFSDCHVTAGSGGIVPSDLGWNSDIVYAKDTNPPAINSTTGYRNRFAAFRTAQEIVKATAKDFLVWVGDHAFTDQDPVDSTASTTSFKFQCYRSVLCFYAPMICRQANYWINGNHEGECGYHQSADGGLHAMQKQSWNVRVACICNPDNTTYAEGGEAGNSSADWVGTADTNMLHSTSTPLQNYYAFTWGDVLFVFLDTFRYTDVGGDDSTHRDEPNQFSLGATQTSWMNTVLSGTSKSWKVCIGHNLPGGVGIGQLDGASYYGRGSGADINQTEPYLGLGVSESTSEVSLHSSNRSYGVTCYIKGHDHKFGYANRNNVFYLTCPTAGAASHTQNTYPGWNQNNNDGSEWTQFQDSYGTSQSLGELDSVGGDLTLRGMVKHYNTIGYANFDFATGSPGTLTGTIVQTVLQTSGSSESDVNKYITQFDSGTGKGYGERWIANQAVTPSSRTVDLSSGDSLNASPSPTMVGTVVLSAAVTGTWWTGLVTERYAAKSPTTFATGAIAANSFRVPTSPNGYLYYTSAGGTATAEPTQNGTAASDWPTTIGNSVTTGGITWVCAQRYNANYKFDERLGSKTIYVSTDSDVQPSYAPRVVYQATFTQKSGESTPVDFQGGMTRREVNYIRRREGGFSGRR